MPTFLYFDLGKVLVDFSTDRMCQQMGAVADVDPEEVRGTIFHFQLQWELERGRITPEEFYAGFCRRLEITKNRPDFDALLQAASDIFWLNEGTAPIIERLRQAGHRLGVLSNTCVNHWEHCIERWPFLNEAFEQHALSYQIGFSKPEAPIYRAAAEMAGVDPSQIFFIDDLPDNVEGAKAAGFDAALYTSADELTEQLRARGIAV
ncbi:MAG: HAD family phosphatase [Planctomycetes bacterium]|nr:HAD family phosphatase [Planctomycetota bacterium]